MIPKLWMIWKYERLLFIPVFWLFSKYSGKLKNHKLDLNDLWRDILIFTKSMLCDDLLFGEWNRQNNSYFENRISWKSIDRLNLVENEFSEISLRAIQNSFLGWRRPKNKIDIISFDPTRTDYVIFGHEDQQYMITWCDHSAFSKADNSQ